MIAARRSAWAPTRKWLANLVTGLAGWGVLVLQSDAGGVTRTEWIALIVLGAQLAVTYLVPNEKPATPRRRRKRRAPKPAVMEGRRR